MKSAIKTFAGRWAESGLPEMAAAIVPSPVRLVAVILSVTIVVPALLNAPYVHTRGGNMTDEHVTWLFSPEGWVAFWTFLLFLATAGLVIATIILANAALAELRESRRESEQKDKETRVDRALSITDKYSYDPIIDAALSRLSDFEWAWKNPKEHRIYIITVLNLLENMASGMKSNTYDRQTVVTKMIPIFAHHIVAHLDPIVRRKFEIKLTSFPELAALDNEWNDPHNAEYSKAYADARLERRMFANELKANGHWDTSA